MTVKRYKIRESTKNGQVEAVKRNGVGAWASGARLAGGQSLNSSAGKPGKFTENGLRGAETDDPGTETDDPGAETDDPGAETGHQGRKASRPELENGSPAAENGLPGAGGAEELCHPRRRALRVGQRARAGGELEDPDQVGRGP